jgi:thymidylate synthase
MENSESTPPEPTGYSGVYAPLVIEANSLGEAWELAVRAMIKRGFNRFVKAPEYQTWTKDSPMFIMVKNPLVEPTLSPKAPITKEMAEEYAGNLIKGMPKGKENSFDYTYYSRLRCYPDCIIRASIPSVGGREDDEKHVQKVSQGKCVIERIDQVEKAIEIFKKDPTRRSVVMHTWVPKRDLEKFSLERKDTSSPCVVLMHPQLVEEKLHLNVVMKTNDLFNAWSGNAYAFVCLQKMMAERLGVGVGHYTHFSVAMQIYQDVYESAKGV